VTDAVAMRMVPDSRSFSRCSGEGDVLPPARSGRRPSRSDARGEHDHEHEVQAASH
jgi:hypothetical protein